MLDSLQTRVELKYKYSHLLASGWISWSFFINLVKLLKFKVLGEIKAPNELVEKGADAFCRELSPVS